MTAFDYVKRKSGEEGLEAYKARIKHLHNNKYLSDAKYKCLLTEEKNIPTDFLERDLRNSQYIALKAREILEDIVPSVVATSGKITSRLREDWQLVDVMQELNMPKYDALGMTMAFQDKEGRMRKRIVDWTKRNDHRHHAMDAIVIAFTKHSYIQYLNGLNARGENENIDKIERKELERVKGKLRFKAPIDLTVFRQQAKDILENALISIKAKNKVVTSNINVVKKKDGVAKKVQITPRGQLHNETIYGSILQYVTREERVGAAFNATQIATVAKKEYRDALMKRLTEFGLDAKRAFTGPNNLEKNPIYLDDDKQRVLPLRVKTVRQETVYTIRKEVSPDLNVEKVIDPKIKKILQQRLEEYGSPQKAFVNLDDHPIWLNKEKGISIKRVTIVGVNNAIALHDKKNHRGEVVLDEAGKHIPVDFVSSGNNHHVAIYRDADGGLQEDIVSFYDATVRSLTENVPLINREYKKDEGYQFLFTMKQNEYFVFPNKKEGFNPEEIDLLDVDNYKRISPNLFRVQKMTVKDYVFRHHLETNVETNKALKDIAWKRCGPSGLEGAVKVRVDHLGQIVHVGEY